MKKYVEMQAINGDDLSAEDYEKFYNVWDACEEANIDTPEEVWEALRTEVGATPIEKAIEIDPDDIKHIEDIVQKFKEKYGHGVDLRIVTEGLIEGVNSINIITN